MLAKAVRLLLLAHEALYLDAECSCSEGSHYYGEPCQYAEFLKEFGVTLP
jgi:hypothetical protein